MNTVNSAENKADNLVECIKCRLKRPEFIIGTVEDHCPHCGFKEGCCD